MIITNENGIRKVLYNGIVYVNPKVIFLDKSHIKIDKSNLVWYTNYGDNYGRFI